jgi:GntR family transcriptional regulator
LRSVEIDPRAGVPAYVQVAAWLRQRIFAGDLRQGDKLPSESDLTGMAGISRETVQRAVRLLQGEGLVETRRGKGTFVSAAVPARLHVPVGPGARVTARMPTGAERAALGFAAGTVALVVTAGARTQVYDAGRVTVVVIAGGRPLRPAPGGDDVPPGPPGGR